MSYTNFKYVGQMSYSLYKAVLHPPKPILKLCIYGYYHYLKVVLKIEQSSRTDKQKTDKPPMSTRHMTGVADRVKCPFCRGEGELTMEDYRIWISGLASLIRRCDP
jgi:hypothetical protein